MLVESLAMLALNVVATARGFNPAALDRAAIGECSTTSNKPCVFPFEYLGTAYTTCTTANNGGTAWCATAVNSGGEYIGQWENCGGFCPVEVGDPDMSRDACMTTSRDTCVFPFKYKGVRYRACTAADNNGILWCATEVDSAGEYVGRWGNCNGNCRRRR